MPTIQERRARTSAIEQRIEELGSAARADAIAYVKALMAQHGLTAADLAGRSNGVRRAGETRLAEVCGKCRDDSGKSWTGRGLEPEWLTAALASGKSLGTSLGGLRRFDGAPGFGNS